MCVCVCVCVCLFACMNCLHIYIFILSRTRPFFTHAKSDAVCVCDLSVGHGYLRWLFYSLL